MRDGQASSRARLARRLGLDGNPLRRRTDKLEVRLAALLVVAFLVGAPVLSMIVIGWVGRTAATEQLAARSWHQVPATVEKTAQAPTGWGILGYTWVPARWMAPDGQARTGEIPVSTSVPAGHTVQLWVDAEGTPVGPEPGRSVVVARETGAAALAVIALGASLLCLAGAGRWVLDRWRLAGWETAWADVGPQWTKRFRSRG